jgi:hypothetical protein
MKTILTIILLGLFSEVSGQSLEEIQQKLRLIKTPETIASDTAGLSQLPKLKTECDDHFEAYDFPENKTKWDYYHVIDLNQDGRNDFIYSGPCLPYDQTSIFINDGLSLKRVFDYAGQIVSIKQLKDRSIITLFKESCCCDYYSDLVEVIVHKDSGIGEKWITFFGNTEITIDEVKKINVTGILRTHPELVDAETKDVCNGEMVKGNQLKNITRMTGVIQLGRSGEWRLIVYPEDAKHSWIGWIKWDK